MGKHWGKYPARIAIRLCVDEKAGLEALAEASGLSCAGILRQAVTALLANPAPNGWQRVGGMAAPNDPRYRQYMAGVAESERVAS